MQLNPVYLYSNKIDVFTNALDSWVGGYRKVYQRNLKIFRSVDNRIDLQVRNGEERAVEILPDQHIVFSLIAHGTQELLLQKDCFYPNDSSANKGRASVTITETELLDLEPGFYQYSLHVETRVDINDDEYQVVSSYPLYSDSQYGVLGTLEISGDIAGRLQDSIVVKEFAKLVDYTETGVNNGAFYHSSIIDANPRLITPNTLHTFQFYATNYTGTIVIQGSLDDGATPNKWVDITTVDLTLETYKNITGKWNFFRIKHTPITGTLDSILYR